MLLELRSLDSIVIVEIEDCIGKEILDSDFVSKYIPCVKLRALDSFSAVSKQYCVTVIVAKSFSLKFSTDKTHLEINITVETSVEDIITLLDYYLDYIRQKQGIYCIHGDAVSLKNRGVLLIGGASGIGKSTVALKLVEKFGYILHGDEKVLINNSMSIIGGIEKVYTNKKIQSNNLKNTNETYISNVPSQICLIVQPVTNKHGLVYIDDWDQIKTDFHIYEELSRKIRGISRRINGFSLPIMSFDDYEIAKKRSDFCKYLANTIKACTIYGDPDKVAKKINDILNHGLH